MKSIMTPFRGVVDMSEEGHPIISHVGCLEALQMIYIYSEFAYEQAAIPVIAGRKSKVETFSGAAKTYKIEAMMGDRKALQARISQAAITLARTSLMLLEHRQVTYYFIAEA
ncbi:hypothetical protein POM88_011232 [Heracleum sosnowskyi]|uniref:Uncharacterized protein n=1 Tax=Heracleum sosnowskyi TaxID=360622 RepID=A0AAD8N116_9APIA|nr:hypothetical protein POM88_011232 [Heracleum sosnowskyi]